MSNYHNRSNRKSVVARHIPFAALAMLGISAVMGYLGGELFLSGRSHPIHWIIAEIFGFVNGMLLVERFGDVF